MQHAVFKLIFQSRLNLKHPFKHDLKFGRKAINYTTAMQNPKQSTTMHHSTVNSPAHQIAKPIISFSKE